MRIPTTTLSNWFSDFYLRIVKSFKTKNCKTCQFLCYQSDADGNVGSSIEPWHERYDQTTGNPLYVLRSWSVEERQNGEVEDACSSINMGMCFKGVWVANPDNYEERARVDFILGAMDAEPGIKKSQRSSINNVPSMNFALRDEINQARSECFWTPFHSGQELTASEEIESRKQLSDQHKKTRRIAWFALLLSIVSVVVGFWLRS